MDTKVECKVHADKTGQTPLWECPCRACFKLERELNETLDIFTGTYTQWKADRLEAPNE